VRATNTGASWGWVTRVIHWTMAALIIFQLGLGFYMANFVEDLFRQFQLTQTHKSWGFVIFVLAVARVVWRLATPRGPGSPAHVPRWQARAASATHGLLYVLILVLPLSGWIYASASPLQDLLGIENTVFGLFAMPDPWQPGDESIASAARRVHGAGAILLTLILLLHAGAALKHHLVDRDDVLRRMSWGR
jgi:cytochrome b561